jgi:hypothetical protein
LKTWFISPAESPKPSTDNRCSISSNHSTRQLLSTNGFIQAFLCYAGQTPTALMLYCSTTHARPLFTGQITIKITGCQNRFCNGSAKNRTMVLCLNNSRLRLQAGCVAVLTEVVTIWT